jgi:hypothetical protein
MDEKIRENNGSIKYITINFRINKIRENNGSIKYITINIRINFNIIYILRKVNIYTKNLLLNQSE